MRFGYDLFALPYLLVAIGCAVVVVGFAATLVLASFARVRAEKRFGQPELVASGPFKQQPGGKVAAVVVPDMMLRNRPSENSISP